jgi:hypothetical protein
LITVIEVDAELAARAAMAASGLPVEVPEDDQEALETVAGVLADYAASKPTLDTTGEPMPRQSFRIRAKDKLFIATTSGDPTEVLDRLFDGTGPETGLYIHPSYMPREADVQLSLEEPPETPLVR